MTIANNQVLRASVVWTIASEIQVNVHYINVSGIVAQTQTQIRADIAQYFQIAYAMITPWMAQGLRHDRTELFIVTTASPEDPLPANALMNGANAGEELPAQVAAEIFYRTGATRHIGRTFLPLFTEGSNGGGIIVPGALADLNNFAGQISSQFTGTNGVVIRKGIYDKSAGLLRFVTTAVVPIHFRTQRRRRIGVGA